MIATIAKQFTFDAAHRLDQLPPSHKCYGMHGHTYQVELVFTGTVDSYGFVVDYADIDTLWLPLHALLDHKVLNEVPGLEVPSTEELAGWICFRVFAALPSPRRFGLKKVRVRESTSTWCEVRPEHMATS